MSFDFLIASMIKEKDIASVVVPYGTKYQQRFIANIPVADDWFSPSETKAIDEVLERYSDY
jgi:hypothetical protein